MAVLKTIIGNVRGPKGDKGDQGIQGPIGPAGPKGDMQDITGKLDKGNLPSNLQNAETILKALQANTGIKFDENLLYLNDSGTKKKGYCYIDKLTDGIFECIQETTTTVNNATYFKNFSNKENSDRLSNLYEYKIEKIDFHTGNVFFEKIGKIGIISICNIFHREDYSDVVYIDIPAWFMFSRSDGVILGSLTSSAGCIGELLVVSNKQIEVLSSDKGRVSLSGQLIVKLKA